MAELPLARKMWRTLEPYHGMIYFAPEAEEAYREAGLKPGRMGYFASRSAAMGAVAADVVIATFFNFNPGLVKSVIPEAWDLAPPERILEARLDAADRALHRALGDDVVEGAEMEEAAGLAREATAGCTAPGRALYAAHAALPWPEPPHLVLWHAITLLREYRGDGHVAALTTGGFTGCEALVMHGASGEVPVAVLRASRAWPDDLWDATVGGLEERGWVRRSDVTEIELTEAGRARRDEIEALTDELAAPPWALLGEDRAGRLRELVRPWSRTITEAGTFTRPPG